MQIIRHIFASMVLALVVFFPALGFPNSADAPKASISGPSVLKAGEDGKYVITLSKPDGAPLTPEDLQEVHKSKMHLLVIDDSMTDYQHLHPVAGEQPGQYVFSFRPATAHNYTVWTEFFSHGNHHYLPLSLPGTEKCGEPCVSESPSLIGQAGGLKGVLSFDTGPLASGKMAMGMLMISDEKGQSVRDLEPVMGAFAHVVGFSVGRPGVLHLHPMGEEPKDDSARSGPELMFHMEPDSVGIIKLFAQVKRDGKDIFIPFTLKVEP